LDNVTRDEPQKLLKRLGLSVPCGRHALHLIWLIRHRSFLSRYKHLRMKKAPHEGSCRAIRESAESNFAGAGQGLEAITAVLMPSIPSAVVRRLSRSLLLPLPAVSVRLIALGPENADQFRDDDQSHRHGQ
jgi:hypothetical protein